MSTPTTAFDFVFAAEQSGKRGAALVIPSARTNRNQIVQQMVRHFLAGGHDEATEIPPTMLVCTRKLGTAAAMVSPVNKGLSAEMQGKMLAPGALPSSIGPLTFADCDLLRYARLPPDAFDFLIVSGFRTQEFTNFYGVFQGMEPTFTVLMVSRPMYSQGELDRWPNFGEPLVVEPPPRPKQPVQSGE